MTAKQDNANLKAIAWQLSQAAADISAINQLTAPIIEALGADQEDSVAICAGIKALAMRAGRAVDHCAGALGGHQFDSWEDYPLPASACRTVLGAGSNAS